MRTLLDLSRGETADILRVDGSDSITARMLEMGMTPGAQVQLIGAAPLGDPLEVAIRGYHLSLRRSEAERIHIT